MRNDAKDLEKLISYSNFTYNEAMWLIACIIAQTKLFHKVQNVTAITAKKEAGKINLRKQKKGKRK